MKKISIKTFYLIAVISIGLIGLAVGSTYAMFTTSAEINNPITISSILTSNDDVMETFEVEVKFKEFITKTIIVNSGNNTNINYGMRYYCIQWKANKMDRKIALAYPSDYGQLLTSNSDTPDAAWFIHPSGGIDNYATSVANMVIPVLYLNAELFIKSGTGTSSSPYQLSV